MKQVLFVLSLLAFVGAPIAVGATSTVAGVTTTVAVTATTEAEQDDTTDESETEDVYDGIEVDVVTEVPSRWGMFWRSVGERVRLATTFDPITKAELRIKYAEERQAIAERILAESDDEASIERAERVLARSTEFVDRVSERMGDIVERADDRAQRFLENITTFETRRTERLERMEERTLERVGDPERLERMLDKLDTEREKVSNRTERLTDIIVNGQLPAEAKERLRNAAANVRMVASTTLDVRAERRDLLDAVRSGEEGAKEALREFNQERQEVVEEMREKQQERDENLREASSTGDRAAVKQLERIEDRTQQREDAREARVAPANHNTTRSNRLAPKAADTQNPLHEARPEQGTSPLAE